MMFIYINIELRQLSAFYLPKEGKEEEKQQWFFHFP